MERTQSHAGKVSAQLLKLLLASASDDDAIVLKAALGMGADPNMRSSDGTTLLLAACGIVSAGSVPSPTSAKLLLTVSLIKPDPIVCQQ
jgi:hypothetical protein